MKAIFNPFLGNFDFVNDAETAASILTKLLTVDGTGSGLDADLLDGQHGSYYAVASTTPIMYTDTKANILAANKTAGQFAYATDTDEVYVSLGSTTWMVSPFKLLTANPDPDIGLYEWNNRLGYGVDYITNKLLANVHFGANASTTEGGTWVDKSAEPYTFKIYLNGEARTIMVDFSTALGHLVHYPFDADQAVEVWTGNSVEIGLNGLPVIQEYETDIGAFPAMRILNGGTF